MPERFRASWSSGPGRYDLVDVDADGAVLTPGCVAPDTVGAGVGDMVLLTNGSAAHMAQGLSSGSMAGIPMLRKRRLVKVAGRCCPEPWTSRMGNARPTSSMMMDMSGCLASPSEMPHFS